MNWIILDVRVLENSLSVSFPMERHGSYSKLYWLVLLLICILTISGCAALLHPGKTTSSGGDFGDRDLRRHPLVQERIELQAALMAFADRFSSQVFRNTFTLENRISSSELRLALARTRLYALSAMYDIVSGPYVGEALLDTLVMMSLSRMVLEEYWIPHAFGEQLAPMLTMFQTLEDEIWATSDKYLTPAQQQDLRSVIVEWRKNNPNVVDVYYVRFDDFGALGRKPTFEQAYKPGGLLAPISEASQAIDEVRLLGERAMFLLSRSQLLINFQIEVAYREMVAQPEVMKMLADMDAFQNAWDRYAEILSRLPRQLRETSEFTIEQIVSKVSLERSKAIDQFMTRLSEERRQMLVDIAAEEQRFGRILPEMKKTLDAGTGLMAEVNRTLVAVEPLVKSMHDEPIDLEEIADASRRVTEMAHALERLLISPGWNEQAPRFQKVLDNTFRKSLILVLVSMAGLLLTLVVYRLVTERWIRRNNLS
jgi:hypothetical protein